VHEDLRVLAEALGELARRLSRRQRVQVQNLGSDLIGAFFRAACQTGPSKCVGDELGATVDCHRCECGSMRLPIGPSLSSNAEQIAQTWRIEQGRADHLSRPQTQCQSAQSDVSARSACDHVCRLGNVRWQGLLCAIAHQRSFSNSHQSQRQQPNHRHPSTDTRELPPKELDVPTRMAPSTAFPAAFKAYQYTCKGDPLDQVALNSSVRQPQLATNQVRVRIHSAATNPVDLKIVAGTSGTHSPTPSAEHPAHYVSTSRASSSRSAPTSRVVRPRCQRRDLRDDGVRVYGSLR